MFVASFISDMIRWLLLLCKRNTPAYKLSVDIGATTKELISLIDLESGLLAKLISNKVITHQQLDEINSEANTANKISCLLRHVIPLTYEQHKSFLEALENTGQKHVANYIRSGGRRPESEYDVTDWPMSLAANEEIEKLDGSWSDLLELMDLGNGLMDELLTHQFVNTSQQQAIESQKTDVAKNERLLCILRRKSFTDYNIFVECVVRTNQSHIAALLAKIPNADEHNVILTAEQQSHLTANHVALVKLIDSTDELVDEMLAVGCLTMRQKMSLPTTTGNIPDITRQLLQFVRRGSQLNLTKFINCLNNTNQEHVSRIFIENGTVETFIVNLSSDTPASLSMYEDLITKSLSTNQHFQHEHSCMMGNTQDLQPVGLQTGHSIAMFYLCSSLEGRQRVFDLYSSEELKKVVNELFNKTLEGRGTVSVEHITWKDDDFEKRLNVLCVKEKLTILAELYHLADTAHLAIPSRKLSQLTDRLPFELIEMVLLKTAGQLFIVLNRMTPRSKICTLVTLCAVSKLWRRTLTYREYNKRRVQRYFRHVCRPLRCTTRLKETLVVGGSVWGVAEHDGKLYVACQNSDRIQVFDSEKSFSRLEDIVILRLHSPNDISACKKTSCLYVADYDASQSQCVIWRVNLTVEKEPAEMFITTPGCWPISLSVNEGRLLMTCRYDTVLRLYDDEGALTKNIALPLNMEPLNAVEISAGRLVVSHGSRIQQGSGAGHNGVS